LNITLFALNSSFTHTNLAVRYLANSLEADGFSADIAEFCLKDKKDNILFELYKRKSSVYAFSVYIWNYREMLDTAKSLKLLLPDTKIILGGPEVSFENESFFKEHPYIDILILGEGEAVITDICRNPDKYLKKCVTGSCTKESFSALPILYDKYPAKGDILYYESSRGCPHRCSYCLSSLTNGVYAKSSEKTLSDLLEFEKLPKKPRIIKFIDRTFNFDIKRAKEIWSALLSCEYTLNYHFEICADRLDGECFEILKKMPAGKIQLEAGIQSCNEKTLEAINRKTDNQKAIENLRRIKSFGNIHIHADLIAGLPYEDKDSLKSSFDKTIDCCDKLQLGFLKMLKGSYIRENAKEHGYIYQNEPPYTVIANKYMDYNDMYSVFKTADTLDRIYSSGRFSYTMEYILKNAESPFELFSDLTKRLPCDIEKISQYDLRSILFRELSSRFNDKEVLERLALDALIWENKNPPKEFSPYYEFKGKEKDLELYSFGFDTERIYYINRTKHIIKS